MILRPYQHAAVEFLTSHERAFLEAPAGSGKTICAAVALSKCPVIGAKVYWLANTREQVDQATIALANVGVPAEVRCVASGLDLSDADAVVMDECHHYGATTWLSILQPALDRGAIVWGLSATPFGEDEERNTIIQRTFIHFGSISREEVMAGGHLVQGLVKFLDLDVAGRYDRELQAQLETEVTALCRRWRFVPEFEHRNRAQWKLTLEHLQTNHVRNAMIETLARDAMELGETVIVLVSTIRHGEQLSASIPDSVVLHSKLPKKIRKRHVDDLRSGKLRCVVATSLMDEGADFPIASTMILAVGGRSATKTIQRTGRVMRPYKDKEFGVIYDFVDRGLGFAYAQHRARKRTYQQLGYQIAR